MTQIMIYENLLKKYERTGKIGPVKPFNMEHAKKVAWSASQSIYERNKKW